MRKDLFSPVGNYPPESRNWPDEPQYLSKCVVCLLFFIGAKQRDTCRECFKPVAAPAWSPPPVPEEVKVFAGVWSGKFESLYRDTTKRDPLNRAYADCFSLCASYIRAGADLPPTPEDHTGHGAGHPEHGPDDPDCPCRTTEHKFDCAAAGCGFCLAAIPESMRADMYGLRQWRGVADALEAAGLRQSDSLAHDILALIKLAKAQGWRVEEEKYCCGDTNQGACQGECAVYIPVLRARTA